MKELDVVRLSFQFNGLSGGTEGTIALEYDGKHFEAESIDGDIIGVLTTPIGVLEVVVFV